MTARLLLLPSAEESTPVLQDWNILYPPGLGYFLGVFPRGATAGVVFLLEATLSQPACLLGPV